VSLENGNKSFAPLMVMVLNAGSSRSQMASISSLVRPSIAFSFAGSSQALKSSFLPRNSSGPASKTPSNNYSKVAIAGPAIGCSAISSKSSNSIPMLALIPKRNAGAAIINF